MRVTSLSTIAGLLLLAAGAALLFPREHHAAADSQSQTKVDRIIEAIGGGEPRPSESSPLIVHEWGTFTSFSGSDGVKLEFRPLVDNDLPGFVRNRLEQSGFVLRKSTIPAIQRMETPVTYFYTRVERDVSVRVDFPDGLLTEFYPPVRDYGPPIDMANEGWGRPASRSSVVPLKDSMLDWGSVHLIPPSALRAQVGDEELSRRIGRHVERTMVPDTGNFGHYAAARETDSAVVQFRQATTDDDGNVTSATDYFEKFLFYRGIGNFELPLTLEALDNGGFDLTNSGGDEVRSLFLVTVHGDELRFRQADGIPAQGTLSLRQSETPSTVDELAEHVINALQAEGLYDKEARAMVNTWEQSWFGEEGTRLFYVLPQRVTDRLLPLRIEPTPDETIRVLVGRMEIMPPQTERHILELVSASASARAQHRESQLDQPFASPALDELHAMGRLAEPALARARGVAETREVREEAAALLADLRNLQAAD